MAFAMAHFPAAFNELDTLEALGDDDDTVLEFDVDFDGEWYELTRFFFDYLLLVIWLILIGVYTLQVDYHWTTN